MVSVVTGPRAGHVALVVGAWLHSQASRNAARSAGDALLGGDTSVLMAIPLVVAAGGGGAGHSFYCCAHGGGGGGASVFNTSAVRGVGMDGYAPVDTPRDAKGKPDLNHGVYNDARDTTGFPPYATNLLHGLAPLVCALPPLFSPCGR